METPEARRTRLQFDERRYSINQNQGSLTSKPHSRERSEAMTLRA